MRKLLLLYLALLTLPALAWGTTSMNLDLKVGDQIYVPVDNVRRILSVNPAIATGEIYSPQKVVVRAVSLGTTFINIWDLQGLGTIRVKVAPVIPLPALSAKRLKGAAPLRITYTNGSESNGSTSPYSQNNWGLSTYFHQLRLEGDTAWGKMNSTVRYEGRNALRDFTRLALSLKNNNHNFELGDYTVDLSEITVPHIFLQGVRLQSSLSPSLKTDLFWGNYGNEFWGKSIIGQYLNVRYLTGIGGTLLLGDALEGSGGYYDSRDYNGAYKSRTVSARLKLNLPNFPSLSGEYARGMGGTKAAIVAATLKYDRFYLSAKYRDIDPAFTTPSTFVSFQGIKGYYFNGSLSLSPLLNFQAEYDGYQNQLNTTAADPNYMNRVYRLTANLSLADLRNAASYTIWDDDRSGYRFGGKVTGSTLTMNQDVNLGRTIRTNAYARYEPTRYTNTYLPDETYDNFKLIYGATARIGPVIFMNVEDENNDKKYTQRTPVSADFIRHRKAELSLINMPVLRIPLYLDMSQKYESFKSDSGIYDEVRNITAYKATYRPTLDIEAYAEYRYTTFTGGPNNLCDRNQTEFYTGMRYAADTKFDLAYGDVAGFVFIDSNGNGTYDVDDEPLLGARVLAGQKAAWTNSEGMYRLRGLTAEETEIKLDLLTVPAGLISTTPNTITMTPQAGETAAVNFGVSGNTLVQGRVFIDANNDGVAQADELPLNNVSVVVYKNNREMAQTTTDANGYFAVRKLGAGVYTVSVDELSLPAFITTSLGKHRSRFELKDGDIKNINLTVEALRTIMGKVYADANRNGVYDPDEAGIPNVEVSANNDKVLTDENGSFILKNLPAGNIKVFASYHTLPPGYRFITRPYCMVKLSPRAETIDGIDFGAANF